MIIYILIALAIIVAGLIVVVAKQPADFRITRSATIPAPPLVVFDEVNDFHRWAAWSPWARMDPTAKNTFEGTPAGVGSTFSWVGNAKVGEGKMTLLESRPSQLIRIRLDFLKPMKATNIAEFTFNPAGGGTLVTWTMTGTNNFMGKAFGLLVNCDKMIGGQFEEGLRNLSEVTATETTTKH
jgi:uncharacterized protein YndB with AHSA1/START domain